MTGSKSQLNKFKQTVSDLKINDEPECFTQRPGKLVRYNPVEKSE